MKVTVLSESPADEAVVRVLVDALLGQETQAIAGPPLRTRGWPSLLDVVPAVVNHLYYRTEAEALVVVADSNHSPIHVEERAAERSCDAKCRLCQLRQGIARACGRLRPDANRTRLKTAIGIAIPAIEAWFRCGRDPQVSEATWIEDLGSPRQTYTKNALKQAVYATDRPSVELAKRRGVQEARRLAEDFTTLARRFPIGFGALAHDVRGWRQG